MNTSSFLVPKTPLNVRAIPVRDLSLETHKYTDINSELDELDREEFYRLKKVSGKKQRDNAAADAEILAARQKAEAEEKAGNVAAPEPEVADILCEQEDNDVIF